MELVDWSSPRRSLPGSSSNAEKRKAERSSNYINLALNAILAGVHFRAA